MSVRNGGSAVVETLAAHGVDTVFGIPGTHNLELYRHLAPCGIRAVTPRHEQGAGYAAEGYARVSGRPGVVLTTSGPGMTNAMTAAATAYAESQPMLVLSPGVPTGTEGRDLGLLHETKDASGAMDRLVRWSRRVAGPEDAADAVTAAFATFRGARPRPVHVEIPLDVLEQQWDGSPWVGAVTAPPEPDAADVRCAATLLAGARRPLVIVGGGAVDAAAEVRALTEALGAPVATTVNGKGVLDESHPLAVGASVRLRALHKAAAESDALLVVGSELGDSDLWEGRITAQTVIRCDIEPGQLHKNCQAAVALLGDAATTLRALRTALPTSGALVGTYPTNAPFVGTHGPASVRASELRDACRAEARDGAATYEEINLAVRAALPADGVLAGDSSQVTYLGSVHFFDVPAPRRFCYTPGYATLGYGLPAAIGASLARPGEPVAVLLGDGAFLFSVQELATAVDLRLPLPIVVVDNGGYREIRDQQEQRGIPPVGVDLPVPDLAALAGAFGAHGVRTSDPGALTALVADALSADRPTVIHLEME
ncbi:acetolactate synthase-1/2/3 large subunit [Pseudonocardia hierapolitana]|uniref:Acetolactate synthase-1/2/3 large subunit n=1 Tax=Pseudonocardia hierapolitana TaxID=1128676 RepID=A0A561T1D5_9PSEU|nr:5-guanidino-2-oxopentanoate decarboxylase [Pseudonocardia hierapolitana]TWF80923.1 acetolactate synthase-1/2/3 large subunit [Pseudonocardia hierapolitana]